MPNPSPTVGCCNAKLKDNKGYCANKHLYGPDIAGGRCKHHGAMSTGARTAAGKQRSIDANTRHSYYRSMLKASWSPEQRHAFDTAPTGTDMSDEIALMRSNIAKIEARILAGEVSIQGLKSEVFLIDILNNVNRSLNAALRSQHEMHPEMDQQKGTLKIEISIGSGATGAVEDVADLEGSDVKELDAPIAYAPEEQLESESEATLTPNAALAYLEDP